ncbi:BZIP domain-containing protein [Favolaschia claudopus]|uniref:BZIP domain-containing protein n=1 Tax=Favolaschia claudopus TaxID=2862362 RepID=A0AAW0DXN5_9AGAR
MSPLSLSALLSEAILSPTDYHDFTDLDVYQPYTSSSSSSTSSASSVVAVSPVPAQAMLKLPAQDSLHCVPTHQLFDLDFPQQMSPSPSQSPSPAHHHLPRLSISINPALAAQKRPATPDSAQAPVRRRATAERISSKDFIPPDVSGLSKREARLVKNRAAAFLSRQRKREEFELMEVRVAELERENARLLAIAKGDPAASADTVVQLRRIAETDGALVSEVEQLRAQLRAAEQRERELNAELTAKVASASDIPPAVKIEPTEPSFPLSPAPPRVQSPHRSAASRGLMVLLCALPSLLSMPHNSSSSSSSSSLPASFSLPHLSTSSSSALDFNSFLPSEYDWSRTGAVMDLDHHDDKRRAVDTSFAPTSMSATKRKLEFSGDDDSGLGGLDISFDASPLDDGKIRVRIHHPSTSTSSFSSRAASPGFGVAIKQEAGDGFAPYFSESSEPYVGVLGTGYAPSSDPFLGVGGPYNAAYPSSSSSSPFMYHSGNPDDMGDYASGSLSGGESDFGGVPSEYSVPDSTASGGRRRVRIALKSMPADGGEGGEWEVQFV